MIIRLLTELDAILDTRIGVMDRLDPEACVRLISNPNYYTRLIDHMEPLCGIEEAVYQEAWVNRTADDLAHAQVTPIVEMLRCQLVPLEVKYGMDPTIAGIELVVNLYPYVVTPEEEVAIGQALISYIGKKTPLRFIWLSPKELTPELVRRDYSGLILYNHHTWLRTHDDYMLSKGIPQVTLVAPKLCHERVPTPEEQKVKVDKPMNMWRFMELAAVEVIGLKFLDVGHYCTALGQGILERQKAVTPHA